MATSPNGQPNPIAPVGEMASGRGVSTPAMLAVVSVRETSTM